MQRLSLAYQLQRDQSLTSSKARTLKCAGTCAPSTCMMHDGTRISHTRTPRARMHTWQISCEILTTRWYFGFRAKGTKAGASACLFRGESCMDVHVSQQQWTYAYGLILAWMLSWLHWADTSVGAHVSRASSTSRTRSHRKNLTVTLTDRRFGKRLPVHSCTALE